jgi:hypothetical protein
MDSLFREPLFYIYFIYCASFLTMAGVTMQGIRKATSLVLVTTFEMLVAFGLTHGIRETIDWVTFILQANGRGNIALLQFLSDIFLVLSFLVLLQFAVNLLSYRSDRKTAYRLIPALLVAAGIIAMVASRTYELHQIALYVRRSFGFAGALLSGVAFCKLAFAMRAIGSVRVQSGLVLGAVGFFAYSVFGGLIVTTVAGQPVQLFRAMCAFAIAVASTLFLGIFRQCEPRAQAARSA